MASRYLVSRVDRFAGLSDRSVPVQLSRIESPDLLNIDFSDRTLVRRKGFSRLTSSCMKDASLALNGYDSYARIPHDTSYDVSGGTETVAVGFHAKLVQMPSAEVTFLSRGYGTGANRFLQISYDPTINSNLGGWRCRAYDATNTTLRNVTVNDGDASTSQLSKVRNVYVAVSSGTTHQLVVTDENGSSIGSQTFTMAGWVNDSFDWIIGCDTTDGTTIPSEGDSSYARGSIGELRMEFTTGASTYVSIAGRELRVNASDDETSTLEGYWKFNDGIGATLTDSSSNANHAVAGHIGPTWVTDTSLILGTAGIRFNGGRGHIQVDATNVAASFTTNGPWGITFLFTPKLAQGETTVRDQTIFWSGTGTTNPSPFGFQVSSDNLVFKYYDGTSTTTVTSSWALSSYADSPIRVIAGIAPSGTSMQMWITDGTSIDAQSSSSPNGVPGSASSNWSIGRLCTQFAEPQTFNDSSAFCIVDDFAFFKNQSATGLSIINWLPGSFTTANHVLTQFSKLNPAASNVGPNNPIVKEWALPMDEGSGNTLASNGSLTTTNSLLPLARQNFAWAEGLVCPDAAPEITLLKDYRAISSTGSFKRRVLVASGTTLYEVDPSDWSMRVVAGNLPKGGKWSASQYGDQMYLACANGQRPIVYDGSAVNQVGIDAPVSVSTITAGSVTGTMAGTYFVYVTFRNSKTGAESNPGPSNSVTISGGNNGIDSMTLPISPDPQVDQRRIWITAAGGTDGSTAYLSATVADNTTATYTTDITAVGTTPTLEYLLNEPAPQGSLVLTWKDRLWVAGNSVSPTRVYYSTAGTLTSFYSVTQFLDTDQDAGDPIVGLKNLRNELVTYFRDGRAAITATGNTAEPFILDHINNDVGAVSHHAILIYENRHIFLGERDVWLWAGEDAENISSPVGSDRPSIKYYVRETIADAYKSSNAHMALDRSRDQLWLAVTTGSNTRNNEVLVLDISQGVWSRYQMDLDIVAEIEDANDEPTLFGASRGYLVKLNTGKGDGLATPRLGTCTGASTTVSVRTNLNLTGSNYAGLYLHVYDATDGTVERVRIARNDTQTFYLSSALSFTPDASDKAVVGGIPWKAEFVADFGSPMSLKRIRWVKAAGFRDETDGNDPLFRVMVEPNVNQRVWPFTSPVKATSTWADGDILKDLMFGGLGRLFRVMISSTGVSDSNDTGEPFPGQDDRIHITEFQIEAEEVSAR